MTDSETPPERRSALGYREFRLFQGSRLLAVIAFQMQSVAVGWQIYSITGRPLDLGLAGLAQFLPSIILWLVTGNVADRFDRRNVIAFCHAVLAAATMALALLASRPNPPIAFIYMVLVVLGTARAFAGPASHSLLPNLVPREHFANAVAWSSGFFQLSVMLGPALGGALYGLLGPAKLFALCAGAELSTLGLLLGIARRPGADRARRAFVDLVAGLRFVWRDRLVAGAISLDLVAVLLGGATALLPIYARDILEVGPWGLGTLRSAPAVGATLVAILLAFRPLRAQAGGVLFGCVALFGVATVVFGLSENLFLSLACLFVAGAADMVSVFVRHTLVQLRTPDAMRGRVSAVNLVFIGASNELGEFESGVTAEWLGAVPAVILGGVGSCLAVLVWAFLFPDLRRVTRLDRVDPVDAVPR